MKSIRIIDKQFNLLGEIDNYESFILTRRWHTYGEFELRINRYKKNTEYLQKDNIIFLGNQRNKAGIITYKEIEVNEGGKFSENWIIKGFTLESLLNRRKIIPPFFFTSGPIVNSKAFDSFTGSAENVIKHYIESHIVDPIDSKRRIEEVILAPSQNRGNNLSWQAQYESLDEAIEKISLETGLGIQAILNFNFKKIVLDTPIGKNLSVDQQENNPVIFSIMYDNIKNQRYTESNIDTRNVGYICGSGEGVDKKIVEIGEVSGWDRKEETIDINIDIDLYAYEEDGLREQGQQKLNEYKEIKTLEGQIINTGPFLYEKDWNLGDIVTIQNKDWGITMNSRITEVREIYEVNGFDIEVTFGNKVPTVLDKIKKVLKK